jgi:hypothetical protein
MYWGGHRPLGMDSSEDLVLDLRVGLQWPCPYELEYP